MTIFGFLRVRNEARWISTVIRSILPVCHRVLVLDDHSGDDTSAICRSIQGVSVFPSPFTGLDESRDKNYLLDIAFTQIPNLRANGDSGSPFWALAIDGDEVLDAQGCEMVSRATESTVYHAFRLPVRYLWDSDMAEFTERRQIRVDGVYRSFRRPSLFRLFNQNFRFRTTNCNGNLHCSSIPQELLPFATDLDAQLWHLGYNAREDRVRKYHWYNDIDPGNQAEDQYRHCVQGDLPEVPADARLMHAGPLELQTVEAPCCLVC